MSRSASTLPLELPRDGPCATQGATRDAGGADWLGGLKSIGLLGRTKFSGDAKPLKAPRGGVRSSGFLDSHATPPPPEGGVPLPEGVITSLKVTTPPYVCVQQPHSHAPQQAPLEVADIDWVSLLATLEQSCGSAMPQQPEPSSKTAPCTPRAKKELTEPPKHDTSRWTDDIDKRLKHGSLSADDLYFEYCIALHQIVYDPEQHSPLTQAIRTLREDHLQILLQCRCAQEDIDQHFGGMRALHFAISQCSRRGDIGWRMTQMLLDSGAKAGEVPGDVETPAQRAAKRASPALDLLFEYGAVAADVELSLQGTSRRSSWAPTSSF
eukprot:TRINITY_DN32856_c0_g2_i1.p1 TRINITY_DN32856_c0_g2~~TRINITY_DN32856_c0_g2_i1.p1  ORF type:complete len:324 (-),score=55.62 TRINITY_DN32856_c0_g2_i1:441-1412(-)